MSFLTQVKRKRNDGTSLNSMILLSFLLHALVLSIILFSPAVPSPKWTFGPTYTVDLVTAPVDVVKTARSVPWDTVKMDSRETAVVMKKKVETVKAIPITPIRVKKREVQKNKKIEEEIDKIKKKAVSPPEPAKPARSSGSGSPAAAAAGTKSQAEMDSKMQIYYSLIWAKIKEKWALPEGILASDNLEAVIAATIQKDGTVGNIEFEKRSGNRFFDESAEKAVKKASPFPNIPEWINDNAIDLGIRFRSSEIFR
ncbi:MAG: TonB family protein [Syntrophales bacterium]|jgi:TonB family protein|nr:TonB family protein [Syntrophales bacterium]MDY0044555.1 TonB family protein [Syntrophales bacterium]